MNYRDSIVQKIRKLAEDEYNLERQVREFNSDRPIDEWIDYWEVRNNHRLSISMLQTTLIEAIQNESKASEDMMKKFPAKK